VSVQRQFQNSLFTSRHCLIKETDNFSSERDKYAPLRFMTDWLSKYYCPSQFCHWIDLIDEHSSNQVRTEARLTYQVFEGEKACWLLHLSYKADTSK